MVSWRARPAGAQVLKSRLEVPELSGKSPVGVSEVREAIAGGGSCGSFGSFGVARGWLVEMDARCSGSVGSWMCRRSGRWGTAENFVHPGGVVAATAVGEADSPNAR